MEKTCTSSGISTLPRVMALDILRGFSMFIISGGGRFLLACLPFLPLCLRQPIATHLDHLPWEGLTFYDVIFPMFIFISGASFTFSWERQCQRGDGPWLRWRRLLLRTLMLVALGILYNEVGWGSKGFLTRPWAEMRWFSVLGRIGVSIAFAAGIYVNMKRRWRWVVVPAGLLLYAGILRWLGGATVYAPAPLTNLWTLAYDQWLVPTLTTADPEGLISTVGSILTAYIGMWTGDLLQRQHRLNAVWLLLCGMGCLIVGYGLSPWIPIIKFLWTPTYLLATAGWTFLLLAGIYALTENLRLRKGWVFFTFIGAHTLVFYFLPWFFDFNAAVWRLLGGGIQRFITASHEGQVFFYYLLGYLALWGMLYLFYKRK